MAPDCGKKKNCRKAKRLMYVIHSLLPQQNLREKTGYTTFTRGNPVRFFLFTESMWNKEVFNLSEKSEMIGRTRRQPLNSIFIMDLHRQAKKTRFIEIFKKTAGKYLKTVRDNLEIFLRK